MGKIDADQSIQHLSHQHPLRLLNIQQHSTGSRVLCSGCKLAISEWAYCCFPCNFCLHRTCSQMPQKLSHRIDPKHILTLTPTPVYEGGAFVCNACGKLGTGFSYHCQECELDLHPLCAFAPSPIPDTPLQQQVNYSHAGPPCHSVSIPTVPGPGFISHLYFPDPNPQVGCTTMRYQPYDHYPGVIYCPFPGHGPTQRNDWGESSLMGTVFQGIAEGLAQQAGTDILQGFLGNS
ncbi:uncharacterized protein LOC115683308 [Syzygium oleosum]|uniref:uncharacterized protein LOC115683308 n=1 Tax=Syzygium oleosum TaxID=219896 RepID=UPI0011D1FA07|nr:uncharacterized protein LOC115683308 [Syzygium oleosum]